MNIDDLHLSIIVGPFFSHTETLMKIIYSKPHISLYKSPPKIWKIFSSADIAICTGGNTLFELACMGIPTLCIPSVIHEIKYAEEFKSQNFSLNLALRESMETYKPNVTPASKSAISNLERYELTEDLLKAAQDPMCVICSEEFKVGDKVLSLPCKHLFHVECCEKWLEINNTCCVCREPIPEMKDQVDQDGDNENVKSSASYVNDVNNTNALANNVNNNNSLSSVEHTEEATVEQIETSPRTTFSTASNNSGMSGSLNRANVTSDEEAKAP